MVLPHIKKKYEIQPLPYTISKINLKRTVDLNTNARAIEFLDGNIGEVLRDFGFDKDF